MPCLEAVSGLMDFGFRMPVSNDPRDDCPHLRFVIDNQDPQRTRSREDVMGDGDIVRDQKVGKVAGPDSPLPSAGIEGRELALFDPSNHGLARDLANPGDGVGAESCF
jgi:hypothetical protein